MLSDQNLSKLHKCQPWLYIPTLYVAEGLPYSIVNQMSVIFYKSLGASSEFIGLTSLFQIPWICKLLWAPLVDVYGTKRTWIVISQVILTLLLALAAAISSARQVVVASAILFVVVALVSATQDVAIDGFYLDALDRDYQALYVGVRSAAYKLAWLIGSGGLVYLAGKIAQARSFGLGWACAFALCSALFMISAVFHGCCLPRPVSSQAASGLSLSTFVRVFYTYFDQPAIASTVMYILIFRAGDALMLKVAPQFLIDSLKNGGLGLSLAEIGLIYGTVGTIFLLLGGIVGGWIIARDGLKRWLWPAALIQSSAILLYWLLAVYKPDVIWVAIANSLEQFSYGLGVSAYTVFLLQTVKQEFKAAHYATATALMALGVMLPGVISGFVLRQVGYPMFFLLSYLASLPGIITIFFLPLRDRHSLSP